MLLLSVSFWNCEKDDLCAEDTPVTPQLIIEFYDEADRTLLKNVSKLVVFNTAFPTNPTFDADAVSKFTIPLETSKTSTTFNFGLNINDGDDANDLADVITFNYSKDDIYISRACGYKTIFTLNENNPIVKTVVDDWIKGFDVIQPSINNQNETHVKIYF